jgi:hypothetical protein
MVSRGLTLAVLVATLGAAGCRQVFGIADTELDTDAGPADAAPDTPDARADAAPGTPDAALDAAPVACPVSYVYPFGGHRYRYVGFTEGWAFARDDCADDVPGTYLAIPDDDLENTQLSQWTGQRSWIGINDLAVEGTLVTVLGQPLGYTNWENGNPSNDSNADCVAMREFTAANPGTWRVESCGLSRPYFCECPGP